MNGRRAVTDLPPHGAGFSEGDDRRQQKGKLDQSI